MKKVLFGVNVSLVLKKFEWFPMLRVEDYQPHVQSFSVM